MEEKYNEPNKYSKLLSNTLIFAIGNLGSKLIVIFLVPLYTYVLTIEEYGLADIFNTTIMLLIPIVTLTLFEAIFRFTIDMSHTNDEILTSSLYVSYSFCSFLVFFSFPFMRTLNLDLNILVLLILLLYLQLTQTILMQFLRGIGKIKLFAFNGIILTTLTLIFTVLFLIIFDMGLEGYLLAYVFANLGSNLFIFIKAKIYMYIRFSSIRISLIGKMLKYSIPLIPNSVLWLLISLSDRYFILIFAGASGNGLYAVASKIPNLLMILNSVFSQAWQISAIEEFDTKEKSNYYSKVFLILSTLMFISSSLILIFLKPLIKLLVAPEYINSWIYVPYLLLGIIFLSFSGFLGTNYLAAKDTLGVLKTTLIGAVLNISLNILLIPIIGVIGASISTFLSFFIVWIIRMFDTRKYVHIKLNYTKFILSFTAINLQIFVMYIGLNYELLYQCIIILLLFLINLNEITSVYKFLYKKFVLRKKVLP